ncbi:gliding motility-associated C-terminal domain-containing protein [Marivirga sp. S37H4]|uniref:Gliding motility-associated C-terminal domain-containing protein n=1 Tax=Marivirga aurantiaca TaxID=2802615 RepID=A0A934WX35_9BACT|nr:gliding motility-associated C-terminal domain-containing protein [Marivirga aurantiaca]MBK6264502.1 gliding motility-associated C-terminal domain-containing protein [Marivirga aurantiaca]
MKKHLQLFVFISFFCFSFEHARAQCPTVAGTTITTCDNSAGGTITIVFTDGDQTNQSGYILYDVSGGTPTAVSDPFGSVSKTYDAGTQTLIYGNIPDGTYLAGRSGCPTLGGFGIVIDQSNELIASVNSVTDDCDNLGSGTIDIDVVGGTTPYSFLWSNGDITQNVTGLSSGTYDVTVTDDNNCTFELTGIVVGVGPNAGVFVGVNGEVCTSNTSFDLTTLLDGSQDAGGSWADTDGSGALITGNTVDFTGVTAGTYDFTYTVTGSGSCADDNEIVTVEVIEAANAGVYVGTAGEACSSDIAFDLTTLLDGSQDAGGSWADTDGSGALITGNTVDFTGVVAGTYDFTYTVTGTAPCGDDSEVVTVNVSEEANAGVFVGVNGEVCTSNTSFDLTTLLDGSQDAGGSWADTDGSGALITGNTVDFTGVTAGTYDFTYTVTGSGSCADDNEIVTVEVIEAANAGVYVGTAGEACSSDIAFDLTTLLDGSQDAGGSWADTDGSGALITGNTVDFTGVVAGTYDFTYTVTGTAPCGDDSEVVTVNVSEEANAGVFVGVNGEVCTSNISFDLTTLLDGSQDAGGSWADTDGSGALITGNTVDFTGVTAGIYDFTYTVTGSGSCADDTEIVTVEVIEAANAGVYVGTEGEACSSDIAFDLTTLLDGSQDAGGSWADTDGSGALITGNTVDFTGVVAGTYDFTYTVTGTAPCGDDSEVVTVNVSEEANAGVFIGVNGEVCTSNISFDLTTLLDGSQDAGGSWADTDGSGALITGNTVDFTGVTAGTYDFTYTVTGSGSCADDNEIVTVEVIEAANAGVYIGTAGEACSSDIAFDLTTLLDGSQDAGGSWADTDGSGALITGNTVDFTGVVAGTYDFTYTVTGTAPCGDDSEVVTVNVSEEANAGVFVGVNGEVCTSNISFDLTTLLDGSQDAGGSWADTDGSGALITGNTVDFTGVTAGTYDFTYTVTGSGSCADDNEIVTVEVIEAANAGVYVGTAGEACSSDIAFDLTTLLDGSQDAGGSWADTDGSGALITGNTVDFTGVVAGTYDFTYTVTGTAPCGDDSEVVTVNVSEEANAGVFIGVNGEVCTSNISFDLTTLLDGSQDAGGSWADTDGSGALITGNTVDFTGVTAGTYDFTYTVTGSGSCADDNEIVTVEVIEAANAGVYVGTAGEACSSDIAFDLTTLLDGSQDAGGSWADTDGSGALITGNTVDFTGVVAGTYDFTYTVTGTAPCGDDSEIVTVNVSEEANAGVFVGVNGEVCTSNTSFDLTTLLDGSQDAGGSWADTDGSGALITGNTVDFTGVTAGTYDFTYTVTGSGSCADDNEIVTVEVIEAANAGVYVGTEGEACSSDIAFDLTTLLDGSQDAGGSWADTDGSGALITGNTVDFTGVVAGTYDFTYTVTGTAPCGDDSEVVTVNVSEEANAGVFVGVNGEVCTSNTSFDLTTLLDGSQDAGGSWADTDGSGALITGNTVDFTGVTAGIYDFTYTVTGSGSCADDNEIVTVEVIEAANAGVFVGVNGEACSSDIAFDLTTLLDGSQDAGGSWADTDGSGALITGNTVDFTGIVAGTYDFTYTVTGTAPCGDDSEVVTVNVSEEANAGVFVGVNGEVCTSNTSFDLTTLLDGSQDAGGSWADTDGSGALITGNTVDFTGVTAGTYDFTYTVTGSGSCADDNEIVTVEVIEAANAGVFVGVNGEACSSDIAFDLTTLLDGSQDAGGSWADTDGSGALITGNTVDFTGVVAGTYDFTYTVTGTAPCGDDSEVVTVNVSEEANAGVFVGVNGEVCTSNTSFDLSTLLDGSQDTGGSWADTDGSGALITGNTVDFTGVTAGTYDFTYTVTGPGSCADDSEIVTVLVNSISATATVTNTTGCGVPDGEIDLTPVSSSGGDTFNFSWSGPNGFSAATEDISALEGGTYTVTVTSVNTGCEVIESFNVIDPVPFTINVVSVGNQTECAIDNGSISIEVVGGTGPFNYYITDDATPANEIAGTRSDNDASVTYSFGALAPGNYNVVVEDGACVLSEAFTVDPVDAISATLANITPADCNGGTNGSIEIDIVPVGNTYTVVVEDVDGIISTTNLTDADLTFTASGLEQGDYTITITDDATNCEVVINETVNENATYSIDNFTVTNIATCGGSEGEILLDISGLSGGETYAWTGPGTFSAATQDLTGLTEAGNYEVTIVDNGCTVVEDFTITAPTPPVANAGSDDTICEDNTTLAANAPQGDEAGLWTVISQPAAATASITADTDPNTTITGLTEVGEYEFVWTLEDAVTLCSTPDTVVITVKTITVADAGTAQQVCGTTATLAANTVATDETGTWTVISGSGSFTDENDPATEVTGLSAGDNIFEWTITDDNNICNPTSSTVTITVTPLPTANAGDDEEFCDITTIDLSTLTTPPSAENGTILWTTSSTDGSFDDNTLETPVYTFGTDDFTNGTVTLTMEVTGEDACSAEVVSDDVVITIGSKPTIETIADAAMCYVDENSTFDVSATVSNEASILWTTTGTGAFDNDAAASTFYTPSVADSTAGTVDLTITAEGIGVCADSVFTFTLTINSLNIDAVVTQPAVCGEEGTIELDILRGSADLVEWTDINDNPITVADPLLFSATAGTYKVFVNDNTTNCQFEETFILVDPAGFTVGGTVTDQSECDVENGSIDVTLTPASTTATFLWTGPGIDASIEANEDQANLAPGNYSVAVTDNGCTVTGNFTVNPVEQINAIVENSTLATCGDADGVISVDVTQVASNSYDVILNDSDDVLVEEFTAQDGTTNPILFSGLAQGSYTIIVKDNVTNCEVSFTQLVNEDAAFSIVDSDVTDIVNCGEPEGAVTLDISGLSGSETYAWTGPGTFSATTKDITGLTLAGDYQVTIEDAGCTVVQNFTITQPAECDFVCEDFKVNPITEAASCFGVEDGQIFVLLSNVSASDSLTIHVKEAALGNDAYVAYRVENIGKGLIVEVDDLFQAGQYKLFVFDDAISCSTDTLTVNIGTKFNITANVDIEQPTCTVSTGNISVSLNGTSDPFTFELYDEADMSTVIASNSTGDFNDLVEGEYVIRFINDTNGCTLPDQQVSVENTSVVSSDAVDISIQQPNCGNNLGVISVSLNDLPSTYEFILIDSDGAEVARNTTGIFNAVPVGVYVVQFVNTVDPNACEISDKGATIQDTGSFTAVASDKEDVVCFGDNTGSVVITLEGIPSGFYSVDNGNIWEEFTSGNRITGLEAVNNILVSDEPGTSDCELSVAVNITNLSQQIQLNGSITLVTEASCTSSELNGEIQVPEVTGGVAPYIYFVDNQEVALSDDRIISGLSRNVTNLIIIDNVGCIQSFEIGSIVSPNEVRVELSEINPDNNCISEPEGIQVVIDQNTIDNVTGPYNLILNKVDETETTEFTLDINVNGSNTFIVGPGQSLDFDFEKGARYRWTVRSVTNEQACSADNFITINGGAIIPDFVLEGVDVDCFGESGSIIVNNILADETIPLMVELYLGNDANPAEVFTLDAIPQSKRFIIGLNNFGKVSRGDYIVRLVQEPPNCGNQRINSESQAVFIDAPTNELQVELVPEPNLPPGVERSREEMNPMPTTRPDIANGAISIRLVSTTSATSYSARIFLLEPLGGNNTSAYDIPTEAREFNSSQTLTFDNLLPGVYEIEYYDSFGCGLTGNRLVFGVDGTSNLLVDFDRRPFVPNVFTPNGDGKNDFFEILNLPDDGAELVISNRDGAIVYRNNSYRPSNLWDGGDQPDGIYFYQLTVDKQVQNGWVEILRGKQRK